jgi:microcystin-dependent protein
LLIYRNNVGLRKTSKSSFLSAEAFIPIGAVFPYAGNSPPVGYLFCDGSLVSRSDFPELARVIGVIYGQGVDPAYFRLPDLRGRFALGSISMLNTAGTSNQSLQALTTESSNNVSHITVSSYQGIINGMLVTGVGIPNGTFVNGTPNSNIITLSNSVAVSAGVIVTFSQVLGEPPAITTDDVTRVQNTGNDLSPSNLGGIGGTTRQQLDLTQGTVPKSFASGSNTIDTQFTIPNVSPYMTLNYIIRSGVSTRG